MRWTGDQASGLRSLLRQSRPRVALFVSGVHRSGKTTAVANLALAGAQSGKNVMVIDEARSAVNTTAEYCGMSGRYDLLDVVRGHRDIDDIVIRGPDGVMILPLGRALGGHTQTASDRPEELVQALAGLAEGHDWLLIDATSGFDTRLLPLALSAHEIVVVMPDDGNGLTGSYAMMKLLRNEFGLTRFRVLATRARDTNVTGRGFVRLRSVADRNLGASVELLGCLPFDGAVKRANALARPLISAYPNAPATRAIRACAEQLLGTALDGGEANPVGILLKRMIEGSRIDFAAAAA